MSVYVSVGVLVCMCGWVYVCVSSVYVGVYISEGECVCI